MANYDTLKATIDAYIRQNGVKAITGPVLNGVLNAMVDSLGNGFLFAGEALPNGNPGTPDQNVVRYATQAGTYTNYGGYVHDGKHLVWFVWHGSWNAYPTQVPTDSSLPARVSQLANDAGYITADALAAFYTKVETDALLSGKQATLVSGDNIKTINGESILGSGDITIQGGGAEPYFIKGTIDFNQDPPAVTITSGTYAEALAAYNDGSPVYAALTEGNGAVNIYPLAQVISPFLVFLGLGIDSVLAVGLESNGTVTAFNSALVHPSDLAPVATSGDYDDLTNKPTIPAAQVQSDWDEADVDDPAYIKNKPSIPAAQVQSDWDEADNTDPSFIRNKPSIGKMGVISQTQTWTQAADGGYDYAMSNPVRGLIPKANIDLFESAGAVFNEQTGYFELNGLTDVSYEEMLAVYGAIPNNPIYGNTAKGWASGDYAHRDAIPIRTTPKTINSQGEKTIPAFTWNQRIEIVQFAKDNIGDSFRVLSIYGMNFSTYGCIRLKAINDIIDANTGTALGFINSYSLETVYVKGLKFDVSFANSARLTAASVAYMVSNAGTATITITMHATAYARATADAAVTAALAAKPNVTLASA